MPPANGPGKGTPTRKSEIPVSSPPRPAPAAPAQGGTFDVLPPTAENVGNLFNIAATSKAKVDPVNDSLASIQSLATKLNKLTNDANRIVSQAEKYLHEVCSVGLNAQVEVPIEGEDRTFLEYRRVANKFRIAIVHVDPTSGEERQCKAWGDSTREEKLATFPRLLSLIGSIEDKLRYMVEATEISVNHVLSNMKIPVKVEEEDDDYGPEADRRSYGGYGGSSSSTGDDDGDRIPF